MGKTKDYTDEQERIARYAKAMGHPARMAILQFLAGRETCFFGDIHEELPIAKATVSQHLKELKEAGLIQGEIEAPKVRYCIGRKPNDYFQFFSVIVKTKNLVAESSRLFYANIVRNSTNYKQ